MQLIRFSAWRQQQNFFITSIVMIIRTLFFAILKSSSTACVCLCSWVLFPVDIFFDSIYLSRYFCADSLLPNISFFFVALNCTRTSIRLSHVHFCTYFVLLWLLLYVCLSFANEFYSMLANSIYCLKKEEVLLNSTMSEFGFVE